MIPHDHEYAERVRNLIPINSLESRLQDQVLDHGEVLSFKKKKPIFEAGARDPYTFYLLEGELELTSPDAAPMSMHAGDENARRALAQLRPRRYTARGLSTVAVCRIERAVLDHILADEQVAADAAATQVVEEAEDDDADWMTRLLNSELFTRLPHDNVQRFFAELEALEVSAGEVVVEQGTQGDYLYIVAEGKCVVTRRAPGSSEDVQLAEFREGDAFGEESLISNSPRNASVRMLSDGFLMRLPKLGFEELVSNPTLKAVPYSEATELVEAGAVWLDVRFADEHQEQAIEGSLSMPLNTLRLTAAKLDRSHTYIVYCDTGARSSTGAFILARLGFDVRYLAGGLERTPLGAGGVAPGAVPAAAEIDDEGDDFDFEIVTSATAAAEPAPAPAPETPVSGAVEEAVAEPPKPAPAPAAADEVATLRNRITVLEAERKKVNAQAQHTVDTAKELKRRYDKLHDAARAERAKREALESDVAAARAEADRQLKMEKARHEGELDKAVKKLEALEQEQQTSSGRLEEERQRLETQLEEAGAKYQEALALKEEVESARIAAEVEYGNQIQELKANEGREAARAEHAESELGAMREKLAELQASSDQALRGREAQDSEIARAAESAQDSLREAKEELEAERARLDSERATFEAAQREVTAERARIESETAGQQRRAEELDQREMDLETQRASVGAEIEAREQSLASGESALSEDKAQWQVQLEKATEEERARLEETRAKLEAEAAGAAHEAAAELVEDRLTEVCAEHELRLVELAAEHEDHVNELRTQAEAAVAKMRSTYQAKLASVRAGFETKLVEQEAVLEEDRRGLELESVRLREALAEAQRIISEVEALHADAPPAPAVAAEPPQAPVPPKAAETPIDGPDLELDIEEPTAVPDAPDADERRKPDVESSVPVIEMPDERRVASGASARVLTPAQIAQLRREMQEKMKGQKSAG